MHLASGLGRMLDAESKALAAAHAEKRERLLAANSREVEQVKTEAQSGIERTVLSKEHELSVDLMRAQIQLRAHFQGDELDINLAKLKELGDADLEKLNARRDEFVKAIEDTFSGIDGTFPNVPDDLIRQIAETRATLANELADKLEKADLTIAEAQQEIDQRRADIESLDDLLGRRL